MTEYTGVIGERPFVDYSLFEIKICPACLYANYEKGFRTYDSINKVWNEPKAFSARGINAGAVKETVGGRLRIASSAGMEGRGIIINSNSPTGTPTLSAKCGRQVCVTRWQP